MLLKQIFPPTKIILKLSKQCVSNKTRYSSVHLFIPSRCIRTRSGTGHDRSNETFTSQEQKQDTSSNSSNDANKQNVTPPKINLTPQQIRMIRIIAAVSLLASAGTTWVIMKEIGINPDSNLQPNGEAVSFNVFAENFIKVGEVEKITYFTQSSKALATLHEGAVIDGKPYKFKTVLVNCDKVPSYAMFLTQLRQIENKLNIGPQEQIPVEEIHGVSSWRFFEFTLGMGILIFLLTQYGRLMAKKMVEKKTKGLNRKN